MNVGVPVTKTFNKLRKYPFETNRFDRREPNEYFYLPVDCPLLKKCDDAYCPLAHTKLEKIFHPIVYKTQACQMAKDGTCDYFQKCAFYHDSKDKHDAFLKWKCWEKKWERWRENIENILLRHNKNDKEVKRKVESILKVRISQSAFSSSNNGSNMIHKSATMISKRSSINSNLNKRMSLNKSVTLHSAYPSINASNSLSNMSSNNRNNIFNNNLGDRYKGNGSYGFSSGGRFNHNWKKSLTASLTNVENVVSNTTNMELRNEENEIEKERERERERETESLLETLAGKNVNDLLNDINELDTTNTIKNMTSLNTTVNTNMNSRCINDLFNKNSVSYDETLSCNSYITDYGLNFDLLDSNAYKMVEFCLTDCENGKQNSSNSTGREVADDEKDERRKGCSRIRIGREGGGEEEEEEEEEREEGKGDRRGIKKIEEEQKEQEGRQGGEGGRKESDNLNFSVGHVISPYNNNNDNNNNGDNYRINRNVHVRNEEASGNRNFSIFDDNKMDRYFGEEERNKTNEYVSNIENNFFNKRIRKSQTLPTADINPHYNPSSGNYSADFSLHLRNVDNVFDCENEEKQTFPNALCDISYLAKAHFPSLEDFYNTDIQLENESSTSHFNSLEFLLYGGSNKRDMMIYANENDTASAEMKKIEKGERSRRKEGSVLDAYIRNITTPTREVSGTTLYVHEFMLDDGNVSTLMSKEGMVDKDKTHTTDVVIETDTMSTNINAGVSEKGEDQEKENVKKKKSNEKRYDKISKVKNTSVEKHIQDTDNKKMNDKDKNEEMNKNDEDSNLKPEEINKYGSNNTSNKLPNVFTSGTQHEQMIQPTSKSCRKQKNKKGNQIQENKNDENNKNDAKNNETAEKKNFDKTNTNESNTNENTEKKKKKKEKEREKEKQKEKAKAKAKAKENKTVIKNSWDEKNVDILKSLIASKNNDNNNNNNNNNNEQGIDHKVTVIPSGSSSILPKEETTEGKRKANQTNLTNLTNPTDPTNPTNPTDTSSVGKNKNNQGKEGSNKIKNKENKWKTVEDIQNIVQKTTNSDIKFSGTHRIGTGTVGNSMSTNNSSKKLEKMNSNNKKNVLKNELTRIDNICEKNKSSNRNSENRIANHMDVDILKTNVKPEEAVLLERKGDKHRPSFRNSEQSKNKNRLEIESVTHENSNNNNLENGNGSICEKKKKKKY